MIKTLIRMLTLPKEAGECASLFWVVQEIGKSNDMILWQDGIE